jgi:hypothetical protein
MGVLMGEGGVVKGRDEQSRSRIDAWSQLFDWFILGCVGVRDTSPGAGIRCVALFRAGIARLFPRMTRIGLVAFSGGSASIIVILAT